VSHPDWKLLVAARDAGGDDPTGWGAALAHMDGCDDCRQRALAADPSLVFRHLPAVATGADEVASMRRAVASLRRASRTLGSGGSAPPRTLVAEGGEQGRRLAAALVLAAAGFGVWFAAGQGEEPPTFAAPATLAATPAVAAAGLPVFEELSRPHEPDVYQMGGDDLTVVMVVDETLDI